jgi:hypothetical protein
MHIPVFVSAFGFRWTNNSENLSAGHWPVREEDMRFVSVMILAAFCIVLLTGNSLASGYRQPGIKVFYATEDHNKGTETAINSINAQIANFLQKEKVEIISTTMSTSAVGLGGAWKLFVTVSITYMHF